jgi:hypothetical protein
MNDFAVTFGAHNQVKFVSQPSGPRIGISSHIGF